MKQNRKLSQIVIVSVIAMVVLACSSGAVAATATPVPTNTPLPPTSTSTSTPEPTSTSLPTATLEPTPAPVGVPVSSSSYELTVLKARRLDSGVHTGDGYYWTANPGNVFIELGVKVKNLNSGTTANVPWGKIYVLEQDGSSWYPNWGGYKAVDSGKEADPASLSVSSIASGDDLVTFDGDVYLRLIYIVTEKKPTTVLFGFEDSPKVEVTIQ